MPSYQSHPIPPVFDGNSRVLILGSFPSVKSREVCFFYGHPQNRFWLVLSALYETPIPDSVDGKREFLLAHGIALWDVIASCEIEGSADQSIKDVRPNDVGRILAVSPIQEIFVNGKTAEKYYNTYLLKRLGRSAVCLPSTSPANAAWSLSALIDAWSVILP